MLNESLFSLPIDALKSILMDDLTILDISITYILIYVVYKSIGRYIYFKPQEHASKINRTFLVLSLMVVSLNSLEGATGYLPFSIETRWLYSLCILVLLIAPLSILAERFIWKYSRLGHRNIRFNKDYLPIQPDYYKTVDTKVERDGGVTSYSEEEVVESTKENLHSDALMNLLALLVFITVGTKWALQSMALFGIFSLLFSTIIQLWVSMLFIDRGVFSWIYLVEKKYYAWRTAKN